MVLLEYMKSFLTFLFLPHLSSGYPLCALPSKSREGLLRVVAQCPPLTKEKSFRHCVDILLGELGAGAPTYGTRIMLLLLIQSNNSVCEETSKMVSCCGSQS